jgi:hypothetical protein
MKTAYMDETAYGGEARIAPLIVPQISPPEATPEPKKVSLRYYWWEFAERRPRPSLYVPSEPEEDADKQTYVFDSAHGSVNDRIKGLRELYDLTDDAAVESYLAQYPFLANVLYAAHAKIRKYFGLNDRLSLKVVEEPDMKDSRRLFVLIHTALRPRDAISVLDELDRGWWLGALSAAEGKLSIDLEYG